MDTDLANQTLLDLASLVMAMENLNDVDVVVEKLQDAGISSASDLLDFSNDAMESKLRKSQSAMTSVEIGHVKGILRAIQQSKDAQQKGLKVSAINSRTGMSSFGKNRSRPQR